MPFTFTQIDEAVRYYTADLASYTEYFNPILSGIDDADLRAYLTKRNCYKNFKEEKIGLFMEKVPVVKYNPEMAEKFEDFYRSILTEEKSPYFPLAEKLYWFSDSLQVQILVKIITEDLRFGARQPRSLRVCTNDGRCSHSEDNREILYTAANRTLCNEKLAIETIDRLPPKYMSLYENGGIMVTDNIGKIMDIPRPVKDCLPHRVKAKKTPFGIGEKAFMSLTDGYIQGIEALKEEILQKRIQGR